MLKRISPLYLLVFILWVAYALLVAYAPITAPIPFHLSKNTVEILRISFVIPYLLIWLVGTFAFVRTRHYAVTIKSGQDGKAFLNLSYGIGGMILGFIATSAVGAFKPYVSRTGMMQEFLVIVANYAFIWLFLVAFVALCVGARQLILQLGPTTPVAKTVIFSLPVFAITYIWLDLIFSNPMRDSVQNTQFVPTYYLSDSLIVMTIVLPSLVTWLAAMMSTIFLVSYYKRVKGVLYRQALLSFIIGAVIVVASGIFLEILISLGPSRLIGLGYHPLVAAIYGFFLLILIGFGFLARGARKLIKIETV